MHDIKNILDCNDVNVYVRGIKYNDDIYSDNI